MATEFEQFKFPVKHKEIDYVNMVLGLLPKGLIWGYNIVKETAIWIDTNTSVEIKQDTNTSTYIKQDINDNLGFTGNKLSLLMSVIGSELARIEELAWSILNQTDPGIATGNTLEDWERNLGLTNTCVSGKTVEERQRAAHSKRFDELVTTTKQAYIDKAATLGFVITINEEPEIYQPFIAGVGRAGYQRLGGLSGYFILEITIVSATSDIEILKCELAKFKHVDAMIVYV